MSPSPNWYGVHDEDGFVWHYGDGNHDAGLWHEWGTWKLSFSLDASDPFHQIDLGDHADERLAMIAAEGAMDQARERERPTVEFYNHDIPHEPEITDDFGMER